MNLHDCCRRLVDIGVSFAALVLFAPLFILISFLVVILHGRPVLFRQWRVGRSGKPFEILKFRTMAKGSTAPVITAAGDLRVTKLGKHLRLLKLDELPQLINVLKGEMSLIGPRPEVPEFVNLQDVFWQKILQVRPGITDVATLYFRNEEQILGSAQDPDRLYRREILPTKLRLNIHYLIFRTWRTDVRLLWLTVRYSLLPDAVDREEIARSFNIPDPELKLLREPPFTGARREEMGIELKA